MTIDESFKKPGSVPFNWEIKPGVPKQPQLPSPPRKLRPPPSAEPEPRSASFSSVPRGRSARWRLSRAEAPEVVSSLGCFAASPLLNRKPSGKKESHGSCVSGLETPRRRSVSSRSSAVSPFRESPGMSFCSSSGRSSPSFKAGSDAEWAGFGLF